MEENLFEEELKPDDECVFCGKLFEDSACVCECECCNIYPRKRNFIGSFCHE